MDSPKPTPDQLKDYVVTTAMLCEAAGVDEVKLRRLINLGHIVPGVKKKGLVGKFWTIGQANQGLSAIGRRDHRIER